MAVKSSIWKDLNVTQDVVKKVLSSSPELTDVETTLLKPRPKHASTISLSHHVFSFQVFQFTKPEVPAVPVQEPTATKPLSIKELFAKQENASLLISLVLINLNVTSHPTGHHAHVMLKDIAMKIKKSDMSVETQFQIIVVIVSLALHHGLGSVVSMLTHGSITIHGIILLLWDIVTSKLMTLIDAQVSDDKSVNQSVRTIQPSTTPQMNFKDLKPVVFNLSQVSKH